MTTFFNADSASLMALDKMGGGYIVPGSHPYKPLYTKNYAGIGVPATWSG